MLHVSNRPRIRGREAGWARVGRVPAWSRRKRTFNEQREYAALPVRVEALETEHQQLQQEAASPELEEIAR